MKDKDGAYAKIVKDDNEDVEVVKEITRLFQAATAALKASSSTSDLKDPLQIASESNAGTTKKKAWDCINEYKESGNTLGYAAAALQHLNDKGEKQDKSLEEVLTNSTTEEQVKNGIAKIADEEIDDKEKKKIKETITPRYVVA